MLRRWNRWSLRTQLSLTISAIMVALLVVFSTIFYLAVRSFVAEQLAAPLAAQTRALLGQRADGPATGEGWQRLPSASPSARQQDELRNIAVLLTTPETSVVVYNPDGSVVARGETGPSERYSGPPWAGRNGRRERRLPAPPPEAGHWAFEQVLRGSGDVRFNGFGGFERQLAVLVPVFEGGELIAVVQVATPSRPVDALLRWLLVALVGGTIAVGITALLLSWWATRSMLMPLRRIVDVTQHVAQGDLSARTELRAGNEIGTVGAAFDHMVAQLQTLFGVQRRFIADAAHELRTPLTAVGGQLELLLLGAVSEPAQQRRSLQRMNGELERMGRLVDDLLTLSRLDARPALRQETVDLSALAQDVAQQMQSLAPDRQIAVRTAPAVTITGDGDRLRQVLLNLLDNARKYTPAGGRIDITVHRCDGNAVVSVADTGIGVSAADVEHVWDRFYRVDQARTRAGGGAGLGLAIVKGIAEAHGGSVALASEAGRGTTVTLTLPLEANDPRINANQA